MFGYSPESLTSNRDFQNDNGQLLIECFSHFSSCSLIWMGSLDTKVLEAAGVSIKLSTVNVNRDSSR